MGTAFGKVAAQLAVTTGGALALTFAASCGGLNSFTCSDNPDCGEGGTCQSNGACSFEDEECPSGQRFGEHSKPGIALECVPIEDSATETGVGTLSTSTSTSSSTSTSTLTSTSVTTEGPSTSVTSMGFTMSGDSSSTTAEPTSNVSAESTTAADSSSTGEPLDPSLVMWFDFEDLPTSTISDATVNGFVGACNDGQCPTPTNGPRGTAALFDGDDDEVSVDATDFSFGDEALTAAAWIRPDQLDGTTRRMVFGHPFGTGIRNSWVLFFTQNTATPPSWVVGFSMNSDIDGPQATYLTPVPFELGGWVHLAGSYSDGASNFYIDGVRVGGLVAGPPLFDDHPITIGYEINNENAVAHFFGAIDDVRFYSRALADDEIAELAAR